MIVEQIWTGNAYRNFNYLIACPESGEALAVDDVSFSIAPGEVVGFLGPNGAGKTTTMRMLTGFLPPTEGGASIAGHDVFGSPLAATIVL